MALVRGRPQLKLRLDLPEIAQHHHCFPPPLVLPVTVASSSAIIQEVGFLSELENLQVLGSGNGGIVYKVCQRATNTIYALKIIRDNPDNNGHRQILQELEILGCTCSPFVVRCHGMFQKPAGDIAILMEYMDAGTLDHHLKTNGGFCEALVADIASQVLKGVDYLHSMKIVHNDIKPSNLLVNQKMEVKIADFGVSKIMSHEHDPCNSNAGTIAYMSPERFDRDAYGPNYSIYAGDVWSLGLTLMELYLGHYPYLPTSQKAADSTSSVWGIWTDEPPSLPEDASEKFRSFIQCCLQKDPSKRWTVSQLVLHPFVSGD